MLFNSLEFAIFLPVVFFLHWFFAQKNLRWQNLILLAASYVFYGSWNFKFLFLLMFSTALDYFSGLMIEAANRPSTRKCWLWLSIGINLGFLAIFKYYDFFVSNLADLSANSAYPIHLSALQVILPIGISFYTFHGLSYVIDIYNRKTKASRDFVQYSLFVSFFPLLVAGPIERATHLLPQLQKLRSFKYAEAVQGLKQIAWGLFKKIVIADSCATYVDKVFDHSPTYSALAHVSAAVLFAFEIYCDFSGYSDIALGTADLFGVRLIRNFAYPYFSRDIAEFWRKWHISLSSWFRDYLYIPLGGSAGGRWRSVLNVFVIFLVSGLWHGANWTFVFWGLINALYFLPLLLLRRNRANLDSVAKGRVLPTIKESLQIALTFALTVFAWIFFRASSIGAAIQYLSETLSPVGQANIGIPGILPVAIGCFLLLEWIGREDRFALEHLGARWPAVYRYAMYYSLTGLILCCAGSPKQFIYFQF